MKKTMMAVIMMTMAMTVVVQADEADKILAAMAKEKHDTVNVVNYGPPPSVVAAKRAAKEAEVKRAAERAADKAVKEEANRIQALIRVLNGPPVTSSQAHGGG